jgi:hypothetical protein
MPRRHFAVVWEAGVKKVVSLAGIDAFCSEVKSDTLHALDG